MSLTNYCNKKLTRLKPTRCLVLETFTLITSTPQRSTQSIYNTPRTFIDASYKRTRQMHMQQMDLALSLLRRANLSRQKKSLTVWGRSAGTQYQMLCWILATFISPRRNIPRHYRCIRAIWIVLRALLVLKLQVRAKKMMKPRCCFTLHLPTLTGQDKPSSLTMPRQPLPMRGTKNVSRILTRQWRRVSGRMLLFDTTGA